MQSRDRGRRIVVEVGSSGAFLMAIAKVGTRDATVANGKAN